MFESVARSATVSAQSPAPKNSTNLPTTPCLRSSSVSVSTRSVAVTPVAKRAGEPDADDQRGEHVERLAEHDRLGLDAADAPAEHAERVDHRRVRVGADQRVGHEGPTPSRALHDRPRCSRLTWWTMPMPGGTTRKFPERALRPAQQHVALAVALVLALDVARVGDAPCRTRRPAPSGRSRGRPAQRVDARPGRRRARDAARIAARSTTAGTPVKSCRITRAGMNASCAPAPAPASRPARARPARRRARCRRGAAGSRAARTPCTAGATGPRTESMRWITSPAMAVTQLRTAACDTDGRAPERREGGRPWIWTA